LGMWNPVIDIATTTGTSEWGLVGKKSYELNNHLGNVLAVISDKKIGVSSGGSLIYYEPEIRSAQDYYPFGMVMPGRKFSVGGYRYGFNGKENDNEVKGEGNQQDYGMRVYDPRLGRFLSVDPIAPKYPELTPFQFASNSPVIGIDQDGLELENANAANKVARYGVDALKIKRVDEGYGNVQTQLYTLKTHGNAQEFTKFRETFLKSPQKITNNFYATYKPAQQADPNTLTPGDEIQIDPMLVAFDVYVRVMDVRSADNSFRMTFATLEGHPEAGYVMFSGSFNEETGEIKFEVLTETRESYGLSRLGPSRPMQKDQWEDVMGNARKFLGKEKKDVTMTENVKEYKYDENQPMGKGKLISDKTETIDE